MKWQALFQQASERPLILERLAEHATAALFASGNVLAQKSLAETPQADLFFLCSLLDAHGVAVPGDVARRIESQSRW